MSNKLRTAKAPDADRLLRIALISITAFFVLTLGVFSVAQATNNANLLTVTIYVVAGLSLGVPLLGALFGIRLARQESRSEVIYQVTPYGRAVDLLGEPSKEAAKQARLQRIIGSKLQRTMAQQSGKAERASQSATTAATATTANSATSATSATSRPTQPRS